MITLIGPSPRAVAQQPRSPWAAMAALLVTAAALAGCGGGLRDNLESGETKNNLDFEMHVFSAEMSVAQAYQALDIQPQQLDCTVMDGHDTVYSLSRYQWSRLKDMALRKTITQTYRNTFGFNDEDDFAVSVSPSDGRKVDVQLTVTPDSCCTFTLQHVGFTVHEGQAQSAVSFSSMYPLINNILVELPPATPGGRYTWILMDINEVVVTERPLIP